MRAAILTEPNKPLEVAEDVELEPPGPGQVRVARRRMRGLPLRRLTGQRHVPDLRADRAGPRGCRGGQRGRAPAWTRLRWETTWCCSPNPACGRCRACLRGRPGACERDRCAHDLDVPRRHHELSRGGAGRLPGTGPRGVGRRGGGRRQRRGPRSHGHPAGRRVCHRLCGADRGRRGGQHRLDRARRLRAGGGRRRHRCVASPRVRPSPGPPG